MSALYLLRADKPVAYLEWSPEDCLWALVSCLWVRLGGFLLCRTGSRRENVLSSQALLFQTGICGVILAAPVADWLTADVKMTSTKSGPAD